MVCSTGIMICCRGGECVMICSRVVSVWSECALIRNGTGVLCRVRVCVCVFLTAGPSHMPNTGGRPGGPQGRVQALAQAVR